MQTKLLTIIALHELTGKSALEPVSPKNVLFTRWYVQNRIVFDFIDTGTGGTEKYQVVYGGNELADAALVPYDILVAHGDEILYIFLKLLQSVFCNARSVRQ